MSHVSKVDLVIENIAHLRAACEHLGCELAHESKWRWYGSWVNDYSAQDAAYHHGIDPKTYGKGAEYVIKVPGATYDVGVYKNPKGPGYVLVYDNYCSGHGIETKLGRGLPALRQEYAAQTALAFARSKGYAARRTSVDGKIEIKLSTRR